MIPLTVEGIALVLGVLVILGILVSMLVSAVRKGAAREGELKSEMAKEALDASSAFNRGQRDRAGLSRLERYRRMREESRLRRAAGAVPDDPGRGDHDARGDGGGG